MRSLMPWALCLALLVPCGCAGRGVTRNVTLMHGKARQAREAAQSLVEIGEDAGPALLAASRSSDEHVRRLAAGHLLRAYWRAVPTDEAVRRLVELMQDENPDTRGAALTSISDHLRSGLPKEQDVRRATAEALPPLVPVTIRLLASSDRSFSTSAARALASFADFGFSDTAVANALVSGLRHDNPNVVKNCARGLTRLREDSAFVPLLDSLAEHREEQNALRYYLTKALWTQAGHSPERLYETLAAAEARHRIAAAVCLGAIMSERSPRPPQTKYRNSVLEKLRARAGVEPDLQVKTVIASSIRLIERAVELDRTSPLR